MLVAFDSNSFRQTVGQFATGVTVISIATPEGVHGMTANAFSSVSLDPPLVLVCVNKANATHRLLGETKKFAVNILGAEQEDIAGWYAGQRDNAIQPEWRDDLAESPVLTGALGWLDCTLEHSYEGGDHTIYVGRVEGLSFEDGDPL